MARKRPEFSVPEIEPRGFQAAVRSPEVIEAEGRQMEQPPSAPSAPRRPATDRSRGKTSPTTADDPDTLRQIRKAIRTSGKDVLYLRLATEEKTRLRDLASSYQRQGIKTSDTELARIAINHLLADHDQNGERSLLARLFESMLD